MKIINRMTCFWCPTVLHKSIIIKQEQPLLLPPEKANNTIGRPIIPFRKVLDGMQQ
jgi:hypothetical protein